MLHALLYSNFDKALPRDTVTVLPASSKVPRFNFSEMTALVVDGNDFARSFTRNILASFRFREIVTASSARDGIGMLSSGAIDIVITEWHLGAMTGGTFVKGIRTLDRVRDNQVPVIVLTASTQSDIVFGARDSGANDFVSRPLILDGFLPRMTQLISDPRPFIRTPGYCGPDRRRKQQPFAGTNRRNRPPMGDSIDKSVLIHSLSERIRKPGGLTIAELAINGGKIIEHESARYAVVCREDIKELMSAIRDLKMPGCDAKTLAEQIYLKSHDLRGMGETFRLPLLSAAGASLCRMLWNLPTERLAESVVIQGLETHAMVMGLVVSENIQDDGGEIAVELMTGLDAISGKVRL